MKSNAIRSRHSAGPSGPVGTWWRLPATTVAVTAAEMRGSSPVTVDGGGRELTFRAVAERAGVGERTVYRHFPTERDLHNAVMLRLEDEAGVDYHEVGLAELPDLAGRFFASLPRFTIEKPARTPTTAVFVGADERRRQALLHAVSAAAPDWPEDQQRAVAGLLDVLWSLPSYERLVEAWQLRVEDASAALSWLIETVVASIRAGEAPTTGQ